MKRPLMDEEHWARAWEIAYRIEQGEADPTETKEDCDFEPDDVCPMCETVTSVKSDASGLRLVCTQCGTVVENFTDEKPEWITGSEKAQTGTDTTRGEAINPLMPYASLNTEIVPTGRIAYRQYKMIKLNRWGAMSAMERSLCVVFNKIERCCGRARVPGPVQYTCKALFRRVYEINLKKHQSGNKREGLRGPKRDGLIAACLYMAFKTHELYWKKDVVARVFDITSGEIRRGISIFWDLVKECPLTDNLAKITGCKQYIRWYSVELGVSRALANFAALLFKDLKQYGIGTSKQPQSVAAWCLWTICQALRPDISLVQLANVTSISKATITDVERVTAGTEIPALAAIFAADMCNISCISNPLTVTKIDAVARAMCRTNLTEEFSLWNLAAFSVYFVLTVNNVRFNEVSLWNKCQIRRQHILSIAQKILPYRDAIISECIGRVYFGPGMDHHHHRATGVVGVTAANDLVVI